MSNRKLATSPVRGRKGSKAPRTPYEAENTLRAKSTAVAMDIISEGPIEGLVDGGKSIYFNDVPLLNPDGSENFKGASIAVMQGLPDQAALTGWNSGASTPVGVASPGSPNFITNASGGFVFTLPNGSYTHASVTLIFPQFLYANRDSGDIIDTSVDLSIELKPNGGVYSTIITDTIKGKCVSAYEKAYRFSLTGSGPWLVRVKRLSADTHADSPRQNYNSFTVANVFLSVEWPLSYPDTAYAAVKIDAEAFGGAIPSRKYDIKGLKIQVPNNYNPVTRIYTGIWDGTFQTAWTDNPAWVYYDLLVNERYGLGKDIPASFVDKWALYTIAQYCDGWNARPSNGANDYSAGGKHGVPDGTGGYEPRFTFNGVINTADEAFVVLQSIAAAFRGMAFYGAGVITATQDRPDAPVKLVTNANVIGGNFRREGSGFRARHTVANILFSDPDNLYKPTIEPVDDPVGLARWGVRPVDVAALGCSKRSQARRLGRWLLDSEKHETEIITYRGGLDQADLRPGDIILVSDRWYQGVRQGGRVKSVTYEGLGIVLDAPVTLTAGQTYTLRVHLPDGTMEDRAVSNVPSTTDTITLFDTFTQEPQPDAVWMLASNAVSPQRYRVIGVGEVSTGQYEVTALFHDTTKFDRVEFEINRAPPSYTGIPTGEIAQPSGMSFYESLYFYNGTARGMVAVSWHATTDPRVTGSQVEVWRPGASGWESVGDTHTLSLDIANITPGNHKFRVRHYDALGRYSRWLTSADVYLESYNKTPENVQNFTGHAIDHNFELSWSPVREHSVCYYKIKYNANTGADAWEAAVDLVDRIEGTTITVPLRDGVYFIKAVTLYGIESQAAAIVVNTATAIYTLNVIDDTHQEPSWSGTKVDVSVSGSSLRLDDGVSSGTYTWLSADLGAHYTCRLTPYIDAAGVRSDDYMSVWSSLSGVPALSSAASSDWSVDLEYRVSQDNSTWSAWAPLRVSDVHGRRFEFRMTLRTLDGGDTIPEVTSVWVSIDMPDRTEGASGVAVGTGGLTVSFDAPFASIPAVAVTASNLATGDYWQITTVTKSSFFVRFFDAAGTGVARTMDWIAKGYGRG